MNYPKSVKKTKNKSGCSAGAQQSADCQVYTKQNEKGDEVSPFFLNENLLKATPLLNGNKTCDISRKKEKRLSQSENAALSRSKIYNLRFKAGDILGGRTASCGCKCGFDERRAVSIMQKDKNLYLSGVETCGSVWNCPVCSLKISQRRAQQVSDILTWSQTRVDCAHGFLTLTTRHNKAEKCKDVKTRVLTAWRKVTQSRKYKEFGAESIRALEVKFSTLNGWHPHLHIALIAEQHNQTELKNFVYSFVIPTYLRLIGCETLAANQKYKEIYGGTGVSDYITKWDMSQELTQAHAKENLNNSYSPFGILHELSRQLVDWRDTDTTVLHIELEHAFIEYSKAFKGSKQLTISRKLKLKFKEFDLLTDEEICKEEQASETKITITRELFKEIANIRAQADILNSYQAGGLSLLQTCLLEMGIDTEYNAQDNVLDTLQVFKGWGKLDINYNFHEHKPPKQGTLKLFIE